MSLSPVMTLSPGKQGQEHAQPGRTSQPTPTKPHGLGGEVIAHWPVWVPEKKENAGLVLCFFQQIWGLPRTTFFTLELRESPSSAPRRTPSWIPSY